VTDDRLVALFRRWGEIEAVVNLSPLYSLFGFAVAVDPELLELAGEAMPGQAPPNILFAAVHGELAKRREHPLAEYYPSLGGRRAADARAPELFREFCMDHRDNLLPVIRSRLVQTNEVRRSALLLPPAALASEDAGAPLALFEIGPSAGLNLLLDRYRYRYGSFEVGDSDSAVLLECEPRGPVPLPAIPRVASRLGIDINPLDVTNEEDVAWLRALLWPEHTDRLALLNAAIEVARNDPPPLLKGDLFELLPERVVAAPQEAAVCIFATFVLNQFTPEMLERLRETLIQLSAVRPIYLVVIGFSEFIEPSPDLGGPVKVWLLRLRDGIGDYCLSSIANPHGRWLEYERESLWKRWRA
jgi:hypothetical protein